MRERWTLTYRPDLGPHSSDRNGSLADILPQIFRPAAMRCEAVHQLASWQPSQNGHKEPRHPSLSSIRLKDARNTV